MLKDGRRGDLRLQLRHRSSALKDYLRLKTELTKGNFKPYYVFLGREVFLKKEAERLIRDSYLGSGGSLEYKVLIIGEDFSIRDALAEARSFPFFSSRKIVVLRLKAPLETKELQTLTEVLVSHRPPTILLVEAEELETKDLEEGNIYYFEVTPYELNYWIKYMAREKGMVISQQAIELLKELVGCDLQALSSEVEKLYLYKGHGIVGLEEVEAVVSDFRLRSAFEVVEALERGDLTKAFLVLERLLYQGEPVPKILGAITWRIRERIKKGDHGLMEALKGLYKVDLATKKSSHGRLFLEAFFLEGLSSLL